MKLISFKISWVVYIAQNMKFSIKDFFIKCDQIRRKLRIWSHLLKKSLMENFIFCAVLIETLKLLKSFLILVLVQKTTGLFWKVFLTVKKVHCIPPIFHGNKFITDFKEKLSYVILSLPIDAHRLKISVSFLLTVKILQINPYLTLPLPTLTLA